MFNAGTLFTSKKAKLLTDLFADFLDYLIPHLTAQPGAFQLTDTAIQFHQSITQPTSITKVKRSRKRWKNQLVKSTEPPDLNQN